MPDTTVFLTIRAKINHSKAYSAQEICDMLGYNSDYSISLLDDDGDEQIHETEILSTSLVESDLS